MTSGDSGSCCHVHKSLHFNWFDRHADGKGFLSVRVYNETQSARGRERQRERACERERERQRESERDKDRDRDKHKDREREANTESPTRKEREREQKLNYIYMDSHSPASYAWRNSSVQKTKLGMSAMQAHCLRN